MKRPAIALFDIDGTLMTTNGAGRRAFSRTFETLYGRADACASFAFGGLTDRSIVRRGLEVIGVPATGAAIDAWLDTYIHNLQDELQHAAAGLVRPNPGVESAVLAARENGMAVGLGTGNILAGARLKLEQVELHRHFAFGGFGSDAEQRIDLIRIGAQRGAALLGKPLSACRVVVIGDTPHDVAAGQAIGAECIGVGTGRYSAKTLRDHGAHAAFDDLSDPAALDALLSGC